MTDERSQLARFLSPESELSLKMVFDNIRNLTTGALFATVGVFFFISGAQTVVNATDPRKTSEGFDPVLDPRFLDLFFTKAFGLVALVGGIGLVALV